MKVQDAMTRNVTACHEDDALNYAAQLMWECDRGAIPVLDGNDVVCGMITDRDLAMAAYTQGLALHQIPVRSAMSTVVHSCAADDTIESALALMQKNKVHRIPVTDGGRPVGMLALSDLMRVLRSSHHGRKSEVPHAETLIETVVLISEPRDVGRDRGSRAASSHTPAAEAHRN
jgi:CBS domain-containing protein